MLRIVNEPSLDGFLGRNVDMQTTLLRRHLVRLNADDSSDNGSDAVGANDEVVLFRDPIFETDDAAFQIDVLTLGSRTVVNLNVLVTKGEPGRTHLMIDS